MEKRTDDRIPQVRALLQSLVSPTDLSQHTNVLLTSNNYLVVYIRETVMYIIKLKDVSSGPPISFNYADIIEGFEENECIHDPYIYHLLDYTYQVYQNFLRYPRVAYEECLRGNEEFETNLRAKAADGLQFFRLNGIRPNKVYLIPMFTRFPAVNKADTIGVEVFDLQDGFLIVSMRIYKKKINREYQMIYRILDLTK